MFNWELDLWRCFLLSLDCISVRRDFEDTLAWTFNSDGMFTVASFCRCLEDEGRVGEPNSKLLWLGFSPPKVEVFFWLLSNGRILVRGVLNSFHYPNLPSLECPLCKADFESVDHLFLECRWSWNLWTGCMSWWGVYSCANRLLKDWFEGWAA